MELGYALNHSQYDEHILPVLLEDCDFESLSWTQGIFQMANFTGAPEEGYQEILGTWGFGFDAGKMS